MRSCFAARLRLCGGYSLLKQSLPRRCLSGHLREERFHSKNFAVHQGSLGPNPYSDAVYCLFISFQSCGNLIDHLLILKSELDLNPSGGSFVDTSILRTNRCAIEAAVGRQKAPKLFRMQQMVIRVQTV